MPVIFKFKFFSVGGIPLNKGILIISSRPLLLQGNPYFFKPSLVTSREGVGECRQKG